MNTELGCGRVNRTTQSALAIIGTQIGHVYLKVADFDVPSVSIVASSKLGFEV